MVCDECGHPYRRQTWSKYGNKYAVWRCENRLKNGTKANCNHSPTLKEEFLHHAIMTAINNIVEDKGDFIEIFRKNVIRVIKGHPTTEDTTTEYDMKIDSLQKKMLNLAEENAKQGAVADEFDEEYKSIANQINELKREKSKQAQTQKKEKEHEEIVAEMDRTLRIINPTLRDFDQELVRRLIQTINVKKGMKLEIQFKSRIVMEQVVDCFE